VEYFNDPNITQFIGIIALVFILFSGGLDTKWGGGEIHTLEGNSPFYCRSSDHHRWCGTIHQLDHRFFPHRIPANRLHRFFHRCRGSIGYLPVTWGKKLKNNIEPTLDLESGTNDPMAYFLTTTLIFLMLNPTTSIEANILLLIQSIGLGGILGVVFGKGMVKLINNINLHIPGLYPVFTSLSILNICCNLLRWWKRSFKCLYCGFNIK